MINQPRAGTRRGNATAASNDNAASQLLEQIFQLYVNKDHGWSSCVALALLAALSSGYVDVLKWVVAQGGHDAISCWGALVDDKIY